MTYANECLQFEVITVKNVKKFKKFDKNLRIQRLWNFLESIIHFLFFNDLKINLWLACHKILSKLDDSVAKTNEENINFCSIH